MLVILAVEGYGSGQRQTEGAADIGMVLHFHVLYLEGCPGGLLHNSAHGHGNQPPVVAIQGHIRVEGDHFEGQLPGQALYRQGVVGKLHNLAGEQVFPLPVHHINVHSLCRLAFGASHRLTLDRFLQVIFLEALRLFFLLKKG